MVSWLCKFIETNSFTYVVGNLISIPFGVLLGFSDPYFRPFWGKFLIRIEKNQFQHVSFIKAIGGIQGHFWNWSWDKTSNRRSVKTLTEWEYLVIRESYCNLNFRSFVLSHSKISKKGPLKSPIYSYKINTTCLWAIILHKKLRTN